MILDISGVNMKNQRTTVSVIGSHTHTDCVADLAYKVGQAVARLGFVLVCGGLDGAMKAACQGAKEAGGMTIGILPGIDKTDANEFVDIALPTTIGFSRNVIVASSADVVIALPGSHGTRCEISYALVYGRPVIDLGDWNIEGMVSLGGIDELENKLKNLCRV